MNAEHLMELDTLARQKIVENTSSNFFVEAGAGSGKTTILVERMVAMVEQGCQVSKICAITFTKAAAKEFYSRFQKRLIERSTEPTQADYKPVPGRLGNPTDETRSRCLDGDHYAPLRNALAALILERSPRTVLDSGCGEGYYTAGVYNALRERGSAVSR